MSPETMLTRHVLTSGSAVTWDRRKEDHGDRTVRLPAQDTRRGAARVFDRPDIGLPGEFDRPTTDADLSGPLLGAIEKMPRVQRGADRLRQGPLRQQHTGDAGDRSRDPRARVRPSPAGERGSCLPPLCATKPVGDLRQKKTPSPVASGCGSRVASGMEMPLSRQKARWIRRSASME